MRRRNQTAAQRQESIFKYIKEFLMENGYPPSVREIGVAVGLRSSSTVHAYLDMLEDRGLIRRDPAKPRAIDILDEKPWSSTVPVPRLGEIKQTEKLLSEDNYAEVFQLPASLVGDDGKAFMVSVTDDTMERAGLFEGDFLLVREQQELVNGDIAVLLLESKGVIIRRYFKDKRGIRLQPEKDGMRSSYVKGEFRILGRATGVYRRI